VTFDVQKAVQTFPQEMQGLLDAVIPRPDDVPPEDRQVQVPFIEGRYAVRVAADRAKAALTKDGAHVGYLQVVFQCTSDTAHNYLAVHKSIFELLGFSDRQPHKLRPSRRPIRPAFPGRWCPDAPMPGGLPALPRPRVPDRCPSGYIQRSRRGARTLATAASWCPRT
jgi:hypothetical protein